MKLIVSLNRDEDGVWIAECPSIPGCVSQGSTKEKALGTLKKSSNFASKFEQNEACR